MQYTILYRFCVLSIFALGPFTALQAAPVPKNIVVEAPQAKQVFEHAKAYHDGQGVAQDFMQAYELYSQAAQLGSVDAKVNLGYMLFIGEGVEQNYYEARTWYSEAAAAGDADAITTLSMMDRLKLGIATADTAEISAPILLEQQTGVELDEAQVLETEGNTDEADGAEPQSGLAYAFLKEANRAKIEAQKTDLMKSEDAVFDAAPSQTVTPKPKALSLPEYVLYLLSAGLVLGAGIIVLRLYSRRRKRLRRQNSKITLTPC